MFTIIPQTVLIGLVVAIVGYFLQQRSWRHKSHEELRDREFKEVLQLINDVGTAIDKRLMALEEFSRAINAGEIDKEIDTQYRLAVVEWMHGFSSTKAKLYQYFGLDTMRRFENEVHRQLREASDILIRTRKLGRQRLSTQHKREHDNIHARLAMARHEAFSFLRELNERLEEGDVGRTALFNSVSAGYLDQISKTYLIQRLLGMKA